MVPKTLDPSSVRRRGQARQHRDHREVHPIHEIGVHKEDSRASGVGCDAPGDRVLRDVVHRASSSHGVGWTNPAGGVPGLVARQRSPTIRAACPLASPKPVRKTRGPGQGPMWRAPGAGAPARRGPEAPSRSRAETRGLTSPRVVGDTTFSGLLASDNRALGAKPLVLRVLSRTMWLVGKLRIGFRRPRFRPKGPPKVGGPQQQSVGSRSTSELRPWG